MNEGESHSRSFGKGDLVPGLWPRLLGNFSWLFAGAAGKSIVGFVVALYLARVFGPRGFGQIAFAQAVLTYFILFTDCGLQTLGTREVATAADDGTKTAGRVLIIRAVLVLISLAIIIPFAPLLTPSGPIAQLLLIFSFALIPMALNLAWVFRGREKMKMVGVSELLQTGSYLTLLLLLVSGPSHLLRVPVLFVAGHALAALLLLVNHLYRWGRPQFSRSPAGHWKLLRTSFPVVITLFLHQIYFNFDTLMLGFMRGDKEVGLYNATYRIIFVILSVNTVFMEAVYPTFAKLFKEGSSQVAELLGKTLSISVAVALPIGMACLVLARPLMLALFGPDYLGGAEALKILVWSASLAFVGANYGYCLVACGLQKILAYTAALGALANIALNLWLIPRFGILGACVATIISQALILFCESAAFARRVKPVFPSFGLLLKSTAASLFLCLGLYALGDLVHVFILVAAGTLVYGAMLWLFCRKELREIFTGKG